MPRKSDTRGKELEALDRELKAILKRNHEAFVGQYAGEINALLGLSREEIDAITPDTTDLETYDQLITVVKEASRQNLSQARLATRIKGLGDVAVTIAKKIPSLATILA